MALTRAEKIEMIQLLEEKERRKASTSILSFASRILPSYSPADHHRQICDALERVERGECLRLMIFMPPRHGKSQLASRLFPSWYLGRNPDKQIIASSYNSDLAGDFGRDVRNIVASPEFNEIFNDVSLRPDSKAADRWHTNKGGQYIAAGVGTAMTGRGAHVALIDDPVKSRVEAESPLLRERTWQWYQSTLYTRLMPGAAIILIQTRWHEDDLAGRLLLAAENGGDQWEVLELPAINELGEALWPEWYPVETLTSIRNAIGPREWSALYQQKPQPDEGTFFQRDWFKWYKDIPTNLSMYIASDFAVTDEGGDFTEHGVFGVDEHDNIYIHNDWWSGQTTADVWIDSLLELVQKHKPDCWFGESGVIRRSVEPFLAKRCTEWRTYFRQEWINSMSDKPTRARAFQARASMGKVYLPDTPKGQQILDQLLRFPAGKYDDKVDACSLFALALERVTGGSFQDEDEDRPYITGRSRAGGY